MGDCAALDGDRGRARYAQLCLAGLFGLAAIVAAALVAQAKPPAHATNLLLVYVGADDCAPCRAWQRGDGAAFRTSALFTHLTYREVKSAHLHDVLADENWPADIRTYRDRLDRSKGVPLWLVVSNDSIVLQRFGTAAWRSKVLPGIRLYSRARRY
jgi:hypothetical protein